MRFLSVCSGIEAASVAWNPLGWHAAAFAEIEPFPCAVLAHHYPTIPNLGDITKYAAWQLRAIDLLAGGTPCQAFSIAGLREGLADPRGNLTLVYLDIVARFRPRWLVWENVPGVLSIDGGRAFGSFLGGLGKLGYGFAYRVLNAQYFGVPQRRRRVFVVAHCGDWRRAAAVLFERESLRGNLEARKDARERVAPTLSARSKGGGGLGTDFDLDGGLIASNAEGLLGLPSLTASNVGKVINNQTPLIAFNWAAAGDQTSLGFDPDSGISSALSVGQVPALCGAGVRRFTPRECERLQGFRDDYTLIPSWTKGTPKHDAEDVARWIQRGNAGMAFAEALKLARHPDGPRYKALGNSWAVPCARWIGERIAMVDGIESDTQPKLGF